MEGPSRIPPDQRLNVFALVMYIPGPLGIFLDDLRRELAPHCNPHAHVSLLPPRSLEVTCEAASEQARALTESWPAFDIELTGIEVFPVTDEVPEPPAQPGRPPSSSLGPKRVAWRRSR